MTLKASMLPSAYEGEIECFVNWVSPAGEDAMPQAGETVAGGDEYLYLRVRKRPVLVFAYS